MPKLTLLCGIPGCGKSSWAEPYKRRSGAAVVLSSDEVRGIVGSGEDDQTVNRETFLVLKAACELLLRQGRDTIIDATNTTKRARADFVSLGRKYGAYLKAVVFQTPVSVAKERNAARQRKLPEHVIERMSAQFETPETPEFDEILFI